MFIYFSLKGTARVKRGQGTHSQVVGTATIPGIWQNFLHVDSNKTALFSYLSQIVTQIPLPEGKQIYVTDGEQVLSNPRREESAILYPFQQEEADTPMLLHVAHAASEGHSKVLIRTVDTDVVAIAVRIFQLLNTLQQLWIAFGTGKSFRYLAIHEIAAAIGPQKALALPMFHALTGCDTVSAFKKKTAWVTWNSFPELTEALLTLSFTPPSIPEETMRVVERFVILMYDKTSRCSDIDKARKKLFTKRLKAEQIPPTLDALEQHLRRAVYQGGYVWAQSSPRPASFAFTYRMGIDQR